MHNEKDILACSWVFLKAQGHLVFVLLKRKKTVNGRWPLSFAGDEKHKNILFGRHFDTEDSGKRVSLIKIVK